MAARMEDTEFLHIADRLLPGQSMRADHFCGASPGTLMVSKHPDRITAYCFRCHAVGYKAVGESMQEKLARMEKELSAEKIARSSVSLPEPRIMDMHQWPRDAALWLYRAGFTPRMVEKLGAYWCPEIGRVVLPVIEDGVPVYWQARSITRKPKILSPRSPREGGLVAKYGASEDIVLCEDMLSAFKVGQVREAWALLGTSLPSGALSEILYRRCRVTVWLDGDKPGQRAADSIVKTLRAYGIHTTNIITDRDPKLYGRRFIKEKLSNES